MLIEVYIQELSKIFFGSNLNFILSEFFYSFVFWYLNITKINFMCISFYFIYFCFYLLENNLYSFTAFVEKFTKLYCLKSNTRHSVKYNIKFIQIIFI